MSSAGTFRVHGRANLGGREGVPRSPAETWRAWVPGHLPWVPLTPQNAGSPNITHCGRTRSHQHFVLVTSTPALVHSSMIHGSPGWKQSRRPAAEKQVHTVCPPHTRTSTDARVPRARARPSASSGSQAPTPAAPRMDPEHTTLREGTGHERPRGAWVCVCETSRTGSSTDGKGARGGRGPGVGWG